MKTKRNLIASLLLLVVVVGMLIGLSACKALCNHEWKDATCTTPKTCTLCQKTEGEALGHTGGTATCTAKAICTTCNTEYGDLAAHNYTQEVVKEETLKSVADCTSAAVYYKSCSCGAISTDASHIFYVGRANNHTYENNICTTCGFDGSNTYYLNFLESFVSTDKISVVLNNLVIECEYTELGWDGALKKLNSVNVAELEISVEDGELTAAAHGEFNLTYVNSVDTTVEFEAIVSDGCIYIPAGGTKTKISIEELLDQYMENEAGSVDSPALDSTTLDFVTDTLVPMIETWFESNKAPINDFVGYALNILFTFEKQADGSVLVTLSKDKLLALNETLATKPVAEVIDIYFGAGIFDSIVDFAFEILDLKIEEIPAYLNDNGIDYDTLVEKIETILPALGAPEDTDIDEILTNSAISDKVIGTLIFGGISDYKTLVVEEIISMMRQETLYTLMEAPEDFATQVKDAINQIFDYASLSLTTNSDGAFTAIHLNINKLSLIDPDELSGVYSSIYLTLSVDIIANGDISVSWSDIVDEINGALVATPEEVKVNAITCMVDDWYYTSYIYFQDKSYRCNYNTVRVYEKDFDSISATIISPAQNGFDYYQLQVLQKEYSFILYTCEENGKTVHFLKHNQSWEPETVKVEEITGGYLVTYEDGTTENLTISQSDSTEVAMAKLYTMVFEDYDVDINFSIADFYYNPTTGEYSFVPFEE